MSILIFIASERSFIMQNRPTYCRWKQSSTCVCLRVDAHMPLNSFEMIYPRMQPWQWGLSSVNSVTSGPRSLSDKGLGPGCGVLWGNWEVVSGGGMTSGCCICCSVLFFYLVFPLLALCDPLKYVKALYHQSFYIFISAEPERGRCSTPRAQRTGSSTLWTDVWTGWGKAQQQLTTGTVRLKEPVMRSADEVLKISVRAE